MLTHILSKPTQGRRILPTTGQLRVEVIPPAPTNVLIQQTAKRLLTTMVPRYLPSHQVARKLQVSSRALGRITGTVVCVCVCVVPLC